VTLSPQTQKFVRPRAGPRPPAGSKGRGSCWANVEDSEQPPPRAWQGSRAEGLASSLLVHLTNCS